MDLYVCFHQRLTKINVIGQISCLERQKLVSAGSKWGFFHGRIGCLWLYAFCKFFSGLPKSYFSSKLTFLFLHAVRTVWISPSASNVTWDCRFWKISPWKSNFCNNCATVLAYNCHVTSLIPFESLKEIVTCNWLVLLWGEQTIKRTQLNH